MNLIGQLGNSIPGGTAKTRILDSKTKDGVRIDVMEYDVVMPRGMDSVDEAWFAREVGLRMKQAVVTLDGTQGVLLQAGAMSYMYGNLQMDTNVKGVGDVLGSFFKAAVTKETMIKPMYRGYGEIGLEPCYRHFIILELNNMSLCIDDGTFFACSEGLRPTVKVNRAGMALLGGEGGLFQMAVEGSGLLLLESAIPQDEIVVVNLNNDQLAVDGNYAVVWSSGLEYTVRRSGRTLIGSAFSGEGLVNCFRGTGVVWLAPTLAAPNLDQPVRVINVTPKK